MMLLAVRRIFAAFLAVALLAATACAEMPAHLVLVRPQASAFYSPYSRAVRVQAQPYPYGYFGARGTTHWQRQFGIHRSYTQWSQK
jgi:hypothetical protein